MTRILLFLICIGSLIELQAQRIEPHIKLLTGVSFPSYSEVPDPDYQFSTNTPLVGQLNVSLTINHIEFGISLEAEGAKEQIYSYDKELRDGTRIPPASRLGAYINYYPDLGNKRFAPYGGLSVERSYFMYGGGFITGTSPTFELARDNSYFHRNEHADNGFSLSMILGTLYHFSPTFSIDFQMRYAAWIEEKAITVRNVTYKENNQTAYSFTMRENRLMPIILLGLNANLSGNNY